MEVAPSSRASTMRPSVSNILPHRQDLLLQDAVARRRALAAEIETAILDLLKGFSQGTGNATTRLQGQDNLSKRLRQLHLRIQASRGMSSKRPATSLLLRTLAMLDSVHQLLTVNRYATLRELYYTHVNLFAKQEQSNESLLRICQAMRIPRHCLHVVGAAKGLVRGHLRICEPTNASTGLGYDKEEDMIWIDGMDDLEPQGHAISPICAHVVRVESMARTVVIVEKETVFRRLLEEGLLDRHKPLVLVTARGYPDMPTRYFLRSFSRSCSPPRFLLLVDADAFGLSIAMTYAFGAEELWKGDPGLTLPNIELLEYPHAVQDTKADCGLCSADIMPLTARDRVVLVGLQRRLNGMAESQEDVDKRTAILQRAVNNRLNSGVKYELDAIDDLVGFVSRGIVGNLPCQVMPEGNATHGAV
eukprot:TRINITY_DN45487_c0_g1_i1.p1 TRINITY_DN45487_c0_g1~~TRINITY_DN45487_c0_g1_i1.p1  ORF type:complete len:418 (-),score=55.94 TRINITY_DN45487_c0_g1_i1:281-1534(-)